MSRRLVPGGYSVTWDGTDAAGQTVANGTYFMRLRTGERRSMTKVMLLK
jgi:flagellar hook assembly protein FlgD